MLSTTILNDGDCLVVLELGQNLALAPGFLQRYTAVQGHFECLGRFEQAADGTWYAYVHGEYDSIADSDTITVATNVNRLDAITALWRNRQRALLDQQVPPQTP